MSKKRQSILKSLGKENFQKLCDESDSIKECLEKLELGWNGSSNYQAFRVIAKEFEVDLTKLETNRKKHHSQWIKENYKIENLFCESSSVSRGTVRKFIIRNNLIEYKCVKCGNIGIWNNEKLILQLDHKNGIYNDHRLENLEFLCPNCHSQTKTYGGKNTLLKKIKEKEQQEKKDLLNNKINQRKIFLNSIDTMKHGWVNKISKEWNVSHTSVRRWIKKYYPELKFFERKK